MPSNWPRTVLTSVDQAEDELAKLAGRRWLCRGQDRNYKELTPTIDRDKLKSVSRLAKLKLERQGIDLFRSTAQFFGPGEERARQDDIVTLAVLRHYGVATRLVDWSMRPHVAAYFAVSESDDADGELWAFDHDRYARCGAKQWKVHPETTTDGSGDAGKFDAKLTAFSVEAPYDWFCCVFYLPGFPRQDRQEGFYSMTRRFGVDHAVAIAGLLGNNRHFHLYVVKASLKPTLRAALHDKHGIWRGSLFPDSAGAAETVKREVFAGPLSQLPGGRRVARRSSPERRRGRPTRVGRRSRGR